MFNYNAKSNIFRRIVPQHKNLDFYNKIWDKLMTKILKAFFVICINSFFMMAANAQSYLFTYNPQVNQADFKRKHFTSFVLPSEEGGNLLLAIKDDTTMQYLLLNKFKLITRMRPGSLSYVPVPVLDGTAEYAGGSSNGNLCHLVYMKKQSSSVKLY